MEEAQAVSLAPLGQEPYKTYLCQLERDLKPRRYAHVIRVYRAAAALARKHGVDAEAAMTAALLHDCCKSNEAKYFRIVNKLGFVDDDFWEESAVFHALLGREVARYIYNIEDESVLNAIADHTTGSPDMDDLAKVIFLADMLEEQRVFEAADGLRALAWEDLDRGMLEALNHMLIYLIQLGVYVDERTLRTRNAIYMTLKGEAYDSDSE